MSAGTGAVQVLLVALAVVGGAGLAWRLLAPPHLRLPGTALGLFAWLSLLMLVAPTALRERWWWLLLAGLAAAVLGAWLVTTRLSGSRRDWPLVAAAAVLPLRVPVPVAGETFNLLVPAYAVLLVLAMQLLADDYRAMHVGRQRRAGRRRSATLLCDLAVASTTLLATASLSWSFGPEALAAGLAKVALFVLPFALGYAALRSALDRGASLRDPAIALLATMSIAAVVGIAQHATGTVWQNPKVIVANRFAPDFRTNSIFWDPNVYGRYLVLAAAIPLAWLAAAGRGFRGRAGAVALLVLLLLGLWYTFSQSSMVALAAAAVLLAYLSSPPPLRWGMLALAAVALLAVPMAARQLAEGESGRIEVTEAGSKLASLQPLRGLGYGSFEAGVAQLATRRGADEPRLRASHSTPVTIAVELGVLGLATYALALAAGLLAALVPGRSVGRWWAGAALLALVAHSLFYAAFWEDPMTWVALAVLASLQPGRPPTAATERASLQA